jgi:hypothetical protein
MGFRRPVATGAPRRQQLELRGWDFAAACPAPFSASALHYSQEQLDEGLAKHNRHPADLTKDSFVWLCIDFTGKFTIGDQKYCCFYDW